MSNGIRCTDKRVVLGVETAPLPVERVYTLVIIVCPDTSEPVVRTRCKMSSQGTPRKTHYLHRFARGACDASRRSVIPLRLPCGLRVLLIRVLVRVSCLKQMSKTCVRRSVAVHARKNAGAVSLTVLHLSKECHPFVDIVVSHKVAYANIISHVKSAKIVHHTGPVVRYFRLPQWTRYRRTGLARGPTTSIMSPLCPRRAVLPLRLVQPAIHVVAVPHQRCIADVPHPGHPVLAAGHKPVRGEQRPRHLRHRAKDGERNTLRSSGRQLGGVPTTSCPPCRISSTPITPSEQNRGQRQYKSDLEDLMSAHEGIRARERPASKSAK